MTQTKKIGLTGGIASGKTTVSDCFKNIGIQIIDADDISHEITEPNGSAFNEIIESFGINIIDKKGYIDRKKMRSIIFDDPAKKKVLEAIIHPKVSENIFKSVTNSNECYLIISVPLLVETGMNRFMDRTLLVDCSEETQIERLMNRDQISSDQAKIILSNQATRKERQNVADDLIVNEKNVTLNELRTEVLKLHEYYSN